MLDNREDSPDLDALDISADEPRAQVWVLAGDALEAPSSKRRPDEVGDGAEDAVGAFPLVLPRHGRGVLPDDVLVPRRGHGEHRREGRGCADDVRPRGAEAAPGVVELEARHAEAPDGHGVARVPPLAHLVPPLAHLPPYALQQRHLLSALHLGQRDGRCLLAFLATDAPRMRAQGRARVAGDIDVDLGCAAGGVEGLSAEDPTRGVPTAASTPQLPEQVVAGSSVHCGAIMLIWLLL
mmetsp:Transcript_6789/g.19293  ORF Transcript_6789/g.19293 Transcript_6789/m.19293 type:complete len:238 (+) Transcript_6789:619-1332(+)